MKRIILVFACLVVMPAQAGDLFRWVDKDGKMNYGDAPSVDASEVVHLKLSSSSGQNDDLPYETRLVMQNFPVTLYVGKGCGELCDEARSLLNKRGIPFSEKVLKTRQDIEAFKQLSGLGNFAPVLEVGKTFIKGFLETQWNNELDIAGYAKRASYRQLQQQPLNIKASPVSESQASPAEPAAQ